MPVKKKITVLDTTLRDGAQGENISFSVEDKIKIARELDSLGIDYIEGGTPFSNETDRSFFEAMKKESLSARLVAFGSTRKKNTAPENDLNLDAIVRSGAPVAAIFGKSWDMQVRRVLGTTLEENLAMIRDSVAFLKKHGLEVIFEAEHFFDGVAANSDYAVSAIKTACTAGADIICLCDTNGGSTVDEIGRGTRLAVSSVSCAVGIHCHNDMALAVAGSMEAVASGATHIQGTLLGFGERCGNTELSALLPDLEFKTGCTTVGKTHLRSLYSVCRRVAQISNVTVWKGKPYIGSSAFAHKGGMHIDAVMKQKESFEHIPPEAVGNERRYLYSEVSGRAAALNALRKINPSLNKDDEAVGQLISQLKELESRGYRFEAAEGSMELLVRKVLGCYRECFSLKSFAIAENYPSDIFSTVAEISVSVNGCEKRSSARGIGPLHALDNAIREAVAAEFPHLSEVHLADYKVRVMNPESSTAASVAVLIESTDGEKRWSTVAAGPDVVQASALALCDSYDYCIQNFGGDKA